MELKWVMVVFQVAPQIVAGAFRVSVMCTGHLQGLVLEYNAHVACIAGVVMHKVSPEFSRHCMGKGQIGVTEGLLR